jgi:hypothetical protein
VALRRAFGLVCLCFQRLLGLGGGVFSWSARNSVSVCVRLPNVGREMSEMLDRFSGENASSGLVTVAEAWLTAWTGIGVCIAWMPLVGVCIAWMPLDECIAWMPLGECIAWMPLGECIAWMPLM